MQDISGFLRGNGFEVRTGASDAEVCVVVVAPGLGEIWADHPEATGKHLVPVKVDDLRDASIPEQVSAINWVFWHAENRLASLAAILVAVSTNQEMWRMLRQLRQDARNWHLSRRNSALLLTERLQVLEYAEVLDDLRQSLGGRDDVHLLDDFLAVSRVSCLIAARTRRRRRTVGAAVLAVVGLISAILIPNLQSLGRSNRNSLVTSGDGTVSREFPEWSALLSADLLLNGTDEQRDLARATLRQSLTAEWSLGGPYLGPGYSVETVLPLTGNRDAVALSNHGQNAVLFGTDVKTGAYTWRVDLPGVFTLLEPVRGEADLVAGGEGGLRVVNLGDHSVRQGPATPVPKRMAVLDGRHAVIVDKNIRMYMVVLEPGGLVREIGKYQSLIDMQATDDGSVRALVRRAEGDFALVDGETGAVLASGSVPEPVVVAGGVVPDEVSAYVAGGDHQIWHLTSGAPPAPTGIAVIDRTSLIRGARDGRVVFGGEAQRPRVVELPSGRDLGVVCRETPKVWDIAVTLDGNAVTCTGPHHSSMWRMPSGALLPVPRDIDDRGLLDLFRSRQQGCWHESQLLNVDQETREALNARVCGQVPEPERK
ncbi:hypothetical protein [Lentzea sp.]|uniref:hypothetical protein n=1 Tax=Lentzea sp. TaxID=56099 RepID=UPI002ED562CA